MTADAADDQIRRLVGWVLSTEVSIEASEPVEQEWLVENVGEPRPWHPLHEAQQGWIDYFDGNWAVEAEGGWRYYWFSRKKDAALFLLMFGGHSSLVNPDRMRLLDSLSPRPMLR